MKIRKSARHPRASALVPLRPSALAAVRGGDSLSTTTRDTAQDKGIKVYVDVVYN
jgi:hypothetical protein